jgi:hypothetical protein
MEKLSIFFSNAYQKAEQFFSLTHVKHLLLGASIFILAFFVQYITYKNGDRKAKDYMVKFLKYSAIFPDSLVDKKDDYRTVLLQKKVFGNYYYTSLPLPKITNCKVERIYQQLTDVALKAHNHLLVTKEFMIQSYVCSSTSAIFFVLAGLALAFITKSGFTNANPYFITLFICSLAVGSFFVSLTKLFKQEQNAKDNSALYIRYINLEQAIRSELVTNKKIIHYASVPCDTTTTEVDRAILFFDKEMRDINQIALGFDSEVVRSLTNLGIDAKLNSGE